MKLCLWGLFFVKQFVVPAPILLLFLSGLYVTQCRNALSGLLWKNEASRHDSLFRHIHHPQCLQILSFHPKEFLRKSGFSKDSSFEILLRSFLVERQLHQKRSVRDCDDRTEVDLYLRKHSRPPSQYLSGEPICRNTVAPLLF